MLDITGKKFNRLVAVKFSHKIKKSHYWLFRCNCGNEKVIFKGSVIQGKTKSCGCLFKEAISKSNTKTGLSLTIFHSKWRSMKQRCSNKKTKSFFRYGGRGINVCDRWNKFINFRDDMYQSYLKHVVEFGMGNTTLDRINNNDGYCKENCKWSTRKEQCKNRVSNIFITYNSKTQILSDWARELGIKRECLNSRVKNGWDIRRALTEPLMLNKYAYK